jgi:hypothetical protein
MRFLWFWMMLWKCLLERCLRIFFNQQSLWSQSETSHTPSLFNGDLIFISYCVLSCIINTTKDNIFYLKLSLFIPYTGRFVQKKVVQDIFSPFDLCLTMYEKHFTYPTHKSSQTLCGNMYLQFRTDISGFKKLETVYIYHCLYKSSNLLFTCLFYSYIIEVSFLSYWCSLPTLILLNLLVLFFPIICTY